MHEAAYQSYIHSMVEPESVPQPRYNVERICNSLFTIKQTSMTEQLITLHQDCLQLLERRKYLLNTVNSPERAAKLKANLQCYLDNMETMFSVANQQPMQKVS